MMNQASEVSGCLQGLLESPQTAFKFEAVADVESNYSPTVRIGN
jgi:hypothetical protein